MTQPKMINIKRGRKKNRYVISILCCMLLLIFLSGCSKNTLDSNEEKDHQKTETDLPKASVEEKKDEYNEHYQEIQETKEGIVESMTLEEKAGQVLMLAFRNDSERRPVTHMNKELEKIITTIKPGGVILFSENIEEEEQVKIFIQDLQLSAKIPMFIAVDEEGGRVSRLTGKNMDFPTLPANRYLGQEKEIGFIQGTGQQLGSRMKELGFNMNMAPVADVDSNPQNPVIGDRSFSSDPYKVGEMATAQALGMIETGVIPVLKHFPGHGDTSEDTHFQQVVLPHTKERMHNVELIPFQKGIAEDLPAIMTAHIMVPAYDEHYPATLSKEIIEGLLRQEMGFRGVVITDALDMAAITESWDSSQAAIKALDAGVDMLLMPPEPEKVHKEMIEAVREGRLKEERLDEAVLRILELKASFGLTSCPLQNDK
ncbi:beta-N-acetylhexosaminidase [Tindallia magadiensis]|uniref:beta-N-acetylhexosaminidase n=1 Tax=Tindallia magadiensis TaxID=69895 RepID=A0A1I3B8K9_9FIRM|nr:beta-N-acetylhexosaminidase [Tindallia magadiensis]SFH58618.1 beta-N-acetylhexosaminidase [Tindallia magadiensis]